MRGYRDGRPRREYRSYASNRPARPDEGKTLPELISDFIDMVRSRPRDVSQLTRIQRIELSRDFAAAMMIVPASPQHSDIGSTAAMCADAGALSRL